jgi:peptidoglycan LD-endopeptidase LytH
VRAPPFAILCALLAGCGVSAPRRDRAPPPAPFESYRDALERTGLADKAIGQAWITAGSHALDAPLAVELPHRALIWFDPARPSARGFRFTALRGQRLTVSLSPIEGQVFLETYEERPGNDGGPAILERTGASTNGPLQHEIERSATYVLRIQPELLIGGKVELAIDLGPSLVFPVDGKDDGAIKSGFGASRDGGRRKHEGVDIFAPKGTSVIAAVSGRVLRVRTDPLGGKVVWQRDSERGLAFYYAHLDEQRVAPGAFVEAGQELGTVGNTGNAARTPSHLHFGIYGWSAIDPRPFLEKPKRVSLSPSVDEALVGSWARPKVRLAKLLDEPHLRSTVQDKLQKREPAFVVGAIDRFAEVELIGGRRGYVLASDLEPARSPIRKLRIEDPERPGPGKRSEAPTSVVIGPVELFREPSGVATATIGNAQVAVLAEVPGSILVEAGERTGWIRIETSPQRRSSAAR